MKQCEYCGADFEPDRKTQKYCKPAHAQAAANARRSGADVRKTPEERADAMLERRLIAAQAGRTAKEKELKAVKSQLDETKDELGRLEMELTAYEYSSVRPRWLAREKPTREHRGALVVPLGDTHYGERVRPEEMAGYNAYNMDIAEKRTRRFFQRSILVARNYLAGVTYDGAVLPLLGDLVSGDIHEELQQTNELSTYETVLAVAPWLEAGIMMWREEFGKVHVVAVPGNHGRNTRKPRYKRRSANNADTFLAKLVASRIGGESGVTFDIPESLDADLRVYGTTFRLEHGDEAKGGTGIQGALAPLMLRVHRKRKVAQAEGRPFDVLMCGHWHQLMSMPAKGLFVNGALKGYDEYARGKGFEPEPPQQGLLVVTPEHGVTVQAPLFVGKREDEGW